MSRSTKEAKYWSLGLTAIEITWLCYVFKEIGVTLSNTPQVFCDNLSALDMIVNPMFYARSKHIKLDYHFVLEKVAVSSLAMHYVTSTNQIVDVFTKPLPRVSFELFQFTLNMHSSHFILKGHIEEIDSAADDNQCITIK